MNKKLFSVLEKNKDYFVVRDCETRVTTRFSIADINRLFKKETPMGFLLSMDIDSPEVIKEMKKADALIERIIQTIPTFLRIRKNEISNTSDTIQFMLFGEMVKNICDLFEISTTEFGTIFRQVYYKMFGEVPNLSNTPLNIKKEK